jgi:serine/threonine protein kinase
VSRLPELGDTVAGRYELLERLGEGGMSVVFRARDRVLGRDVALKLLAERYLGRAERERRLLDEAAYLARLAGTPGIVALLDHGLATDRHDWPFLVTELLVGPTLDWHLIKHAFTPTQRSGIARRVAEALHRCHTAGIVHRDLTPSNVAIAFDPLRVELFDFSHAADLSAPRVEPGDSGRLTGIFEVPGTSGYMGPEQAAAAPPDAKMDVFAFGVLLYELVTGRNPYPNVSHQEFVELQRAGRLEPPRLQAWAYEVDPRWVELVRDCTQAEPRLRPTMAEIVARLENDDASSGLEPNERAEVTERAPLAHVGPSWGPPPNVEEPAPAEVPPIAFARPDAPAIAWTAPEAPSTDAVEPPPTLSGSPVRSVLLVLIGIGIGFVAAAAIWCQPPTDTEPHTDAPIVHDPGEAADAVDDENLAEPPATQVGDGGEPLGEPVAETGAELESAPEDLPSRSPPAQPPIDCEGVDQKAEQAKRTRDWSSVLVHTRSRKCWQSERDRLRLRVEALAQAKRWTECIQTAAGHSDPEIERWRIFCTKNI